MALTAGIYVITAPSGRRYIGSASNFAARWRVHRCLLRKGAHHSAGLQAIVAKHGLEALRFERLLICAPDMLVTYEQIAIDALRPELNACPVAGNTLGYRHTDATKAKFAERRQRAPRSAAEIEAHRQALSRPLSPENYAALCERAKKRRGPNFKERRRGR